MHDAGEIGEIGGERAWPVEGSTRSGGVTASLAVPKSISFRWPEAWTKEHGRDVDVEAAVEGLPWTLEAVEARPDCDFAWTRTFSGFTSRWTTCCSCRYCRTSSICAA